MRFFIFSFMFQLFILNASAQGENVEIDTLEVYEKISIEISPSIQWNTVFNKMNAYAGLELTSILREKYIIGIYGEYFLGKISKRVVFPNFYLFDHYKFGVVGGFNCKVNDLVHIRPKIMLLYTTGLWTEEEEKRFYTSDSYLEIFPEITFALFPVNKIYIFGGLGYRIANNTNLISASNSELSGLNLSTGIKVRLYSK